MGVSIVWSQDLTLRRRVGSYQLGRPQHHADSKMSEAICYWCLHRLTLTFVGYLIPSPSPSPPPAFRVAGPPYGGTLAFGPSTGVLPLATPVTLATSSWSPLDAADLPLRFRFWAQPLAPAGAGLAPSGEAFLLNRVPQAAASLIARFPAGNLTLGVEAVTTAGAAVTLWLPASMSAGTGGADAATQLVAELPTTYPGGAPLVVAMDSSQHSALASGCEAFASQLLDQSASEALALGDVEGALQAVANVARLYNGLFAATTTNRNSAEEGNVANMTALQAARAHMADIVVGTVDSLLEGSQTELRTQVCSRCGPRGFFFAVRGALLAVGGQRVL